MLRFEATNGTICVPENAVEAIHLSCSPESDMIRVRLVSGKSLDYQLAAGEGEAAVKMISDKLVQARMAESSTYTVHGNGVITDMR